MDNSTVDPYMNNSISQSLTINHRPSNSTITPNSAMNFEKLPHNATLGPKSSQTLKNSPEQKNALAKLNKRQKSQ